MGSCCSISRKPKVSGPGRTLGGSASSGYNEVEEGTEGEHETLVDARSAAAAAAEQRSNAASQKSGKLVSQLEQQKRKTQGQLIKDRAKGGQQEQLVWD